MLYVGAALAAWFVWGRGRRTSSAATGSTTTPARPYVATVEGETPGDRETVEEVLR